MKVLVIGGSGFIGINYIDYALVKGVSDIINIDIKPPVNQSHQKFYRNCDIMDYDTLEKIIKDFKPTHVVHLAAKTGVHSVTDIKEFAPNMKGVENIINILQKIDTVKHAIFTSSLLVCKMGYIPENDTDYMPSTAYGISKVEGEKIVRNHNELNYNWTIIRPISVWGPWMIEPYINFFKAVAGGWYFHIGHGHYKRSMGYSENIAHEIHSILLAPEDKVNNKTFYVGDPEPTDLYDFAKKVGLALSKPKIFKMPYKLAKSIALTGDVLKFIGWTGVPLSSFRLNNIRTEYIFDLSPILGISEPLPYNIDEGIERSVKWMKDKKIIR